jgi:RNA polymerase sigma-70 factor (ECF subfamily)
VNGQLGFACYALASGADRFLLGASNLLSLRAGRIVEITGFLDPDVHRQVDVPAELPAGDLHAD